jgi:hypothetical protein
MIADVELASAINATAGAMIRNYFALFDITPRIGMCRYYDIIRAS